MNGQQEKVTITLQDIATVVQMIDAVSQRGGIRGEELAGIGMLRNKLVAYVNQNAPADQQIPQQEVEVLEGEMADKVS